jgi:predicted small lipoprotein YifL
MKKLIAAILALALVISLAACAEKGENAAPEETSSMAEIIEPETKQPTPEYSAQNRISETGLEEDLIYELPYGKINPAIYEPLLLINGEFNAKGKALVPGGEMLIGQPYAYVSVTLIAEAFGGQADYDDAYKTLTANVNGHTLALTADSTAAVFDGEDVTLARAPITDGKAIYVAADDDFARYFNVDINVLPDFEFPGFACNPILAVDAAGTNVKTDEQSAGILEYVKEQLTAALGNIGGGLKDALAAAAPQIQADIDNMTVIGTVSRYVALRGPYYTLVDVYTTDIYFYTSGVGYCGVWRADITDPELFLGGYVAG